MGSCESLRLRSFAECAATRRRALCIAGPSGFLSDIWACRFPDGCPALPGRSSAIWLAFDFFLLLIFCIPLLWRFIFQRLLWKVRNRLIVTYLLMGLTPVVLFVTLAGLLLYVFSGQFAIFAATSVVHDELEHIGPPTAAWRCTSRMSSVRIRACARSLSLRREPACPRARI
jgi:hypothetical protein